MLRATWVRPQSSSWRRRAKPPFLSVGGGIRLVALSAWDMASSSAAGSRRLLRGSSPAAASPRARRGHVHQLLPRRPPTAPAKGPPRPSPPRGEPAQRRGPFAALLHRPSRDARASEARRCVARYRPTPRRGLCRQRRLCRRLGRDGLSVARACASASRCLRFAARRRRWRSAADIDATPSRGGLPAAAFSSRCRLGRSSPLSSEMLPFARPPGSESAASRGSRALTRPRRDFVRAWQTPAGDRDGGRIEGLVAMDLLGIRQGPALIASPSQNSEACGARWASG